MPKLDTRALLEERAHALQRQFGKRGAYGEGRIDFPAAPFPCSVSYVNRRSIMSTNYFLSLAAQVACPEASGPKSSCFLNRLGVWKVKGATQLLRELRDRLRADDEITRLTRETDLDSVVLTVERETLTVRANLYGGGFSAILLPPIRFKVDISREQLSRGARLLRALVEVASPVCGGGYIDAAEP